VQKLLDENEPEAAR